MSRIANLAAVCVLTLAAAGSAPSITKGVSIAEAAGTCGTASPFFTGVDDNNNGNSAFVAAATISTQTPTLCSGTTGTYSTAWTMINGPGTYDGWVQSGYEVSRVYTSPTVFSQICENYYPPTRKCTGQFFEVTSGPATGSNEFDQIYVPGNQTFASTYDGGTLQSTTFNPNSSWTLPWVGEWEGETNNSGTDVPGNYTNPVYFSSMQKGTCASGCLASVIGTPNTTSGAPYDSYWVTTGSTMAIETQCYAPC